MNSARAEYYGGGVRRKNERWDLDERFAGGAGDASGGKKCYFKNLKHAG